MTSGSRDGGAASDEGGAAERSAAGAASAPAEGGAGDDEAVDGETPAEPAAPDVPATLGVEARTVVVGRVIAFTGQGFAPGEQVVASLSGGLAAAGPLVAGAAGEVAGVLTLPADIRTGSHTLTLVGAASGDAPEMVLTVVEDPVLAAAALQAQAEQDAAGPGWPVLVAAAAGLVLLALLITSGVTALVRRRRRRRAARTPDVEPVSTGARS
ncbi:hypothetical protein C8046_06080 [Serinibacter arcticus]|uniref:Uncharacterized protein n=1 Tax=Serinibacter arcticus TaxID=1655435 RepID=A0A2U1ZTI8_9MICO|nr:hypothetical protein [Serinibacter arcticus]PWD50296.1 hypothetical protein C8046_06080 [Serinibacter arcticus]